MSGQRPSLQPGFVLHRRPYRETSQLLEAFTREQGRIGLVARGARRQGKRARPPLEPFQEQLLSWSQRGELGSLTQAEPVMPALPPPVGEALLAGLYLNELLLRLTTRHDPHPELYDAYRASLQRLAAGTEVAPLLRCFEKRLLQELGYGLNLTRTLAGEPVRPGILYDYEIGRGARELRGGTGGTLTLDGASLLALEQERLEQAEALAGTRQLLRAALAAHLGDRPLQTPDLLRSLRRLHRTSGQAQT